MRLSERARLLLLSLLIAIGAWWYVVTFAQPAASPSSVASLKLSNVEVALDGVREAWRVSMTPTAVDIDLRWPASGLLAVRPGDVRAIADVSALPQGRHQVALRIQVPAGVTAVQATPASVTVTLQAP